MSAVLAFLSRPSDHLQFHTFCIAVMLTGIFMVSTATDLGAMGPLVISLGIYSVIFAVLAELLLSIRLLVARLSSRALRIKAAAALSKLLPAQ